jgi:MFS transporter, DHA1 family, tetracycline resistance protein
VRPVNPEAAADQASAPPSRPAHMLEPWFAPFALVNGSAVGLVPILLPVVASRYGIGHVGLVMGAFNLGAFAAPVAGSIADRYHAYRLVTLVCAAATALSLWLFALANPWQQLLLALINGAGFAAAVTIASLLIVERQPRAEWNQRLGWLETALSIGQGVMLVLAAWLSGLHARPALVGAAIVPAAAVPLALLVPRWRPTAAVGPAAAAGASSPAGTPSVAGPPSVAGTPSVAGPPLAAGSAAPAVAHHLRSAGHVGEWGPASPSRTHHVHQHPSLGGLFAIVRGEFGWLLAAWVPAYAGTAIVFALYPVLFRNAFQIAPHASALAFAVIVFVSLPLFLVAGRVSQRRGPAVTMAGALGSRVILLTALALLAAAGHVPAVLPLAAFAGIMFAWSYLSVASPGLTGQLAPGDEGNAQGALNAGSGLAGLAGSVVGGFAASRWGYPAALGIGAGAVAVGLTIFVAKIMRRSAAPDPAKRSPEP